MGHLDVLLHGAKGLMEGIPDSNDDESWNKAPYALNYAISVWGRSLQKLHESTLETLQFYCCRNLYLFIDALVKRVILSGLCGRSSCTSVRNLAVLCRSSIEVVKIKPFGPWFVVSVGTRR